MKEDLQAFLRSRRSIRHFRLEAVPDDIVQRILETTLCAPSAHNLQPWRFFVLTSSESKVRLAEAIAGKFRQDMIRDSIPETEIQVRVGQTVRRAGEAPVIIVLCRDKTRVRSQPDYARQQVEVHMSVQSVALAGLQLLLAAQAEGLGGNWICWPLFAPDETRRALELPPALEPEGMLFLGYPDGTPEMPARGSLQEMVRYL
jgi:F420 biosynthesis protein FbiB-like protein